MDPFGGNMGDPNQFMRYGYAGANPVWGMDPSGKSSLGVAAGIGIGVGIVAGLTAKFAFGYTWGQSALIGLGFGIGAALIAFSLPAAVMAGLAYPWMASVGISAIHVTGAMAIAATLGFMLGYWPGMRANSIAESISGLTPGQTDNDEATRIGRAIANTFNYNWKLEQENLVPGKSEMCKGYFCYEWAYAFKKAFDAENPSGYTAIVESSKTLGDPMTGVIRSHYWVKITSVNSGQSVYVDDGFWNRAYTHENQPCHPATIEAGPRTYHYTPDNLDNPSIQGFSMPTIYNAAGQIAP
jgi:hypothetical protein